MDREGEQWIEKEKIYGIRAAAFRSGVIYRKRKEVTFLEFRERNEEVGKQELWYVVSWVVICINCGIHIHSVKQG